MRAKEFTFKKTRTVKTTTEFVGLSLDLTVEEAKALERIVGESAYNEVTYPIFRTLQKFVMDNRDKPSPQGPALQGPLK